LCNPNNRRLESPECMGMIMCSPNQCNQETHVDWTSASHASQYFRSGNGCHCGPRFTMTGISEGLNNSMTQNIQSYVPWCGCETPCRTLRHAGGGMNNMKSYCGHHVCQCLGSPGRPGLVRITYA
jgi:hypothetical protein